MRTVIVIPCFNEASKIAETVAPLISAGYTVVVADDGSTDGTDAVLRALPVIHLRHAVNLGAGAATETGLEYARRAGAELVVTMDADGQHDWRQIPEMIRPIQEARSSTIQTARRWKTWTRCPGPPKSTSATWT